MIFFAVAFVTHKAVHVKFWIETCLAEEIENRIGWQIQDLGCSEYVRRYFSAFLTKALKAPWDFLGFLNHIADTLSFSPEKHGK